MNIPSDWLSAFPVQPATEAAQALLQAWMELAAQPLPGFNRKTHEPRLTKLLKIYLETYIAPKRGLLGMWSAEDIIGVYDPVAGTVVKERRTDIVYGWNDSTRTIKVVFEFKRLRRGKRDLVKYLGNEGLRRFVTGIYGRGQAMAAMVGVLLDAREVIVPRIAKSLEDPAVANSLRLQTANGTPFMRPSLFPGADFDTEHRRNPAVAPSHGTIRVAHIFLEFGY